MLSTLTNVFAVPDGHYNLACVAGVERKKGGGGDEES